MKLHLIKLFTISCLTASTAITYGAGTIYLSTDGSGNFTDGASLGAGSWSGDGTVTANLNGTGNTDIISNTTTGGTLSVGNFRMNASDPATYINGDKSNTGIALNITVTATGAGASFNIGGRQPGTAGGWENLQITNMLGVETLTVTYSFSAPIASVRGGSSAAPYLVGMRRAAGVGTYDATGTIENLTIDGDPYDNSVFTLADFVEVGNASWDNSTGIGSITNEPTSGTFNAMTRLDIDGDGSVATPTTGSVGNFMVEEIERTYATGMTWFIENNAGGPIQDGSEFYFSFNGVQYPDTFATVVPEPASVSMILIGLSLSIGYRRRSHK